jgi:hypothetical protein
MKTIAKTMNLCDKHDLCVTSWPSRPSELGQRRYLSEVGGGPNLRLGGCRLLALGWICLLGQVVGIARGGGKKHPVRVFFSRTHGWLRRKRLAVGGRVDELVRLAGNQ